MKRKVQPPETMNTAILNVKPFPSSLAPPETGTFAGLDELHARYGQRIFRFLFASTRDRDLAETLTQETFLRAWSATSTDAQFRGDSSHATWLTRIALNLLRDHTRTNRFRFWRQASRNAVDAQDVATHLPHPAASAESDLIARQQLALVWQTVATLSERQRTVFLLRFVEELELTEIAAITACPVSTVKTHLYRALAAVRAQHNAAANKESR